MVSYLDYGDKISVQLFPIDSRNVSQNFDALVDLPLRRQQPYRLVQKPAFKVIKFNVANSEIEIWKCFKTRPRNQQYEHCLREEHKVERLPVPQPEEQPRLDGAADADADGQAQVGHHGALLDRNVLKCWISQWCSIV